VNRLNRNSSSHLENGIHCIPVAPARDVGATLPDINCPVFPHTFATPFLSQPAANIRAGSAYEAVCSMRVLSSLFSRVPAARRTK
jgi:hypothetical protein